MIYTILFHTEDSQSLNVCFYDLEKRSNVLLSNEKHRQFTEDSGTQDSKLMCTNEIYAFNVPYLYIKLISN